MYYRGSHPSISISHVRTGEEGRERECVASRHAAGGGHGGGLQIPVHSQAMMDTYFGAPESYPHQAIRRLNTKTKR